MITCNVVHDLLFLTFRDFCAEKALGSSAKIGLREMFAAAILASAMLGAL